MAASLGGELRPFRLGGKSGRFQVYRKLTFSIILHYCENDWFISDLFEKRRLTLGS